MNYSLYPPTLVTTRSVIPTKARIPAYRQAGRKILDVPLASLTPPPFGRPGQARDDSLNQCNPILNRYNLI